MPQAVDGTLRKFALRVPEVIYQCSGIMVFGKRIKSLVFSTDLSIIKNVNADAIIAVYPFTPQPIITQALLLAADIPVFAGVGGGLTQGQRVVNLAMFAEMQGATGVVLNAPTASAVVSHVAETIDIPIVLTVARADTDFDERIKAGADIFNVSAAAETPAVVRCIREQHPDVPIIATGGPTDESILKTIQAGANAITWTPPSNGEIFRDIMAAYRENKPHPLKRGTAQKTGPDIWKCPGRSAFIAGGLCCFVHRVELQHILHGPKCVRVSPRGRQAFFHRRYDGVLQPALLVGIIHSAAEDIAVARLCGGVGDIAAAMLPHAAAGEKAANRSVFVCSPQRTVFAVNVRAPSEA